MAVKRLILTSCTAKKDTKPGPAGTFYKGLGHQYVVDGVRSIREALGPESVDLKIVSAKYGVLNEMDIIEPYDMTFRGMATEEIIEHSRSLKIHEQLQEEIPHYSLVIYCLGADYMKALELPFMRDGCTTHFFMLGKTHENLLKFPDPNNIHSNYHMIPTGSDLAKRLGVMSINLKGYLIKELGSYVKKVYEDPNNFSDTILNVMLSNPESFKAFIEATAIRKIAENQRKKEKQVALF